MRFLGISGNLITVRGHPVPFVVKIIVSGLVVFKLRLRCYRLRNNNLWLAQDVVEFVLRLGWLPA